MRHDRRRLVQAATALLPADTRRWGPIVNGIGFTAEI
jgi:hypothetical protein